MNFVESKGADTVSVCRNISVQVPPKYVDSKIEIFVPNCQIVNLIKIVIFR